MRKTDGALQHGSIPFTAHAPGSFMNDNDTFQRIGQQVVPCNAFICFLDHNLPRSQLGVLRKLP